MDSDKTMSKEEVCEALHKMRQGVTASGDVHDRLREAVDLACEAVSRSRGLCGAEVEKVEVSEAEDIGGGAGKSP